MEVEHLSTSNGDVFPFLHKSVEEQLRLIQEYVDFKA